MLLLGLLGTPRIILIGMGHYSRPIALAAVAVNNITVGNNTVVVVIAYELNFPLALVAMVSGLLDSVAFMQVSVILFIFGDVAYG